MVTGGKLVMSMEKGGGFLIKYSSFVVLVSLLCSSCARAPSCGCSVTLSRSCMSGNGVRGLDREEGHKAGKVPVKVATPRNRMYNRLQSSGTILLTQWFGSLACCLLAPVMLRGMGVAGCRLSSCRIRAVAFVLGRLPFERPVRCGLRVATV
jgi:hypothetical protein